MPANNSTFAATIVQTTIVNRTRRNRCRSACGEPGALKGFSVFILFPTYPYSSAGATTTMNLVTALTIGISSEPPDQDTVQFGVNEEPAVQFLHRLCCPRASHQACEVAAGILPAVEPGVSPGGMAVPLAIVFEASSSG